MSTLVGIRWSPALVGKDGPVGEAVSTVIDNSTLRRGRATPRSALPRRHRVVFLVPDNFSMLELGAALEAFAEPPPGQLDEWYDVAVCSSRPGTVRASGGVFAAVIAHGPELLEGADTVIVPQAEDGVGTDAATLDALRRAHARGARLVSWWSGTFVVAQAGLLDGVEAAVHWRLADDFARLFPRVRANPHVLFLGRGRIVTSAGTAASIDVALHLIREDFGARVARHVARLLVVAPHRDGSHPQYVDTPLQEWPPPSCGVSEAMDLALRELDRDLTLADLARAACMSPRNFSRRFREVTGTSPARWIAQHRIRQAQALLEETDHPVEQVARLSGFASPVTFRQRFARALQVSPSAYRRAYRARFAG